MLPLQPWPRLGVVAVHRVDVGLVGAGQGVRLGAVRDDLVVQEVLHLGRVLKTRVEGEGGAREGKGGGREGKGGEGRGKEGKGGEGRGKEG